MEAPINQDEQDEPDPEQDVIVTLNQDEVDEPNPEQSVEHTIYDTNATNLGITNEDIDSSGIFEKFEFAWVNVSLTMFPPNLNQITNCTLQVYTHGDAENFTLYYNRSANTFTELEDPDDIAVVNGSTSVAYALDDDTLLVCFYFYIGENATDGWCDVNLTSSESHFNTTDNDIYYNVFLYNDVGINPIIDILNAAAEYFGVTDFFDSVYEYVTGVAGYFASSVTNFVLLIVQQFRIITSVFTWLIRWVTRLFTVALDLGEILVSIFNGTAEVSTYIGNWWTYFSFSTWGTTFLPLVAIIYWLDSVAKRGRTQGEIQVFINDLLTFTNVLSYFMTMFTTVINIVIDTISRFADYIINLV